MRAGGVLALFALLPSPALADDEPICADRPGKANPSCTVPQGRWQVETGLAGWAHERSGAASADEWTIGSTAVKFGISDRLHVELDLPAYVHARAREPGFRESVSGLGDSGLALKYRVTADSAPVQVALYPFVKLPTARHALGNRKLEGGMALLADGGIGGTSLGWNIAPEIDLAADGDGRGHHLAMVQVVSIGVPVGDRLSLATDLWGQWDWDPAGTERQFTIGPSAAYLLGNDVQLDAGMDFGLNRAAPDVEAYAGIALRF